MRQGRGGAVFEDIRAISSISRRGSSLRSLTRENTPFISGVSLMLTDVNEFVYSVLARFNHDPAPFSSVY